MHISYIVLFGLMIARWDKCYYSYTTTTGRWAGGTGESSDRCDVPLGCEPDSSIECWSSWFS